MGEDQVSLSSIYYQVKPRRLVGAFLTALVVLIAIGLVFNAITILRLPQTGLHLFQIIWVSFTACVVLILLALAIAAGLESLAVRLTPKYPSEEWFRNEVRYGHIRGIAVTTLTRSVDVDRHKGAIEPENRSEKGNTSMAGQLPHRGEDPLLKSFDSDFPEPGENAEHSGEPEAASMFDSQ